MNNLKIIVSGGITSRTLLVFAGTKQIHDDFIKDHPGIEQKFSKIIYAHSERSILGITNCNYVCLEGFQDNKGYSAAFQLERFTYEGWKRLTEDDL